MRNLSELKEHVLTQCKETKNLEIRLGEMLTRITGLKNRNDLMELTYSMRTSQSIHKFQQSNQSSRRKDIRD